MARKRKSDDKQDAERVKKRNRSLRNRERREQRKRSAQTPQNNPDDLGWLKNISIRMAAMKVLNATVDSHWPYWLSIPSLGRGRNHPTSDFYPCKQTMRGDRAWYGFMFREHRDLMCERWVDARKELTPNP